MPDPKSRAEALNDGVIGADTSISDVAFDLDGTWTSIYTLDTREHTAGYDISEIRAIAGWPMPRADQQFEVFYATVLQPGVFVSLGTFSYLASDADGALSSMIDVSRDNGSLLATGVGTLRFDFMSPGAGHETAYREVDVLGTPTAVPEPLGAIWAAGLMLLGRRGRRR